MARDLATRMVNAVDAVLPTRFPRPVEILACDGEYVTIRLAGQPARLRWVGDGWPSRIRDLVTHGELPHDTVLVAASMSPGAAKLTIDHGYGWVDERQGADFVIGTVAVTRPQTRPAPAPAPGWTPATTGVAEALLVGVTPTVAAVRDATTLSAGACSKALAHLTSLDLLEADAERGPHSARRLADPGRLLDMYAEEARTKPDRQLELVTNPLWRDLFAELARLNERWQRWAVTGLAAGHLLAPVITSVTSAVVYVDASTLNDLTFYAREIDAPVVDGATGRLTLRPFPTPWTMRLIADVDGIPVAPWPRVYVDLLHAGVRGEDAAEHLRELHGG